MDRTIQLIENSRNLKEFIIGLDELSDFEIKSHRLAIMIRIRSFKATYDEFVEIADFFFGNDERSRDRAVKEFQNLCGNH